MWAKFIYLFIWKNGKNKGRWHLQASQYTQKHKMKCQKNSVTEHYKFTYRDRSSHYKGKYARVRISHLIFSHRAPIFSHQYYANEDWHTGAVWPRKERQNVACRIKSTDTHRETTQMHFVWTELHLKTRDLPKARCGDRLLMRRGVAMRRWQNHGSLSLSLARRPRNHSDARSRAIWLQEQEHVTLCEMDAGNVRSICYAPHALLRPHYPVF